MLPLQWEALFHTWPWCLLDLRRTGPGAPPTRTSRDLEWVYCTPHHFHITIHMALGQQLLEAHSVEVTWLFHPSLQDFWSWLNHDYGVHILPMYPLPFWGGPTNCGSGAGTGGTAAIVAMQTM